MAPFLIAAPGGLALLLVGPWPMVLLAAATAIAGTAMMAWAASGGAPRERALVATAGLLLAWPDPRADAAGALMAALALALRPQPAGSR